MKVVFAGTPPFARVALQALHGAGHEIAAVLTQPDRPAGRGMKLQASAVKQWSQDQGLPVWQPRSLKLDGRFPEDAQAAQQQLMALRPDVMVVAAYGLLLPAWVLSLPAAGCLNIHASLLPRWRGAAPVQRAIEAGDPRTGITIMQMDQGLDTGAICLMADQPIHPHDTTASLMERLSVQGGGMIVEALDLLARGALPHRTQPGEGVTYAHKIDKTQAQVDWQEPAEQLERRLRAFTPSPGLQAEVAGQVVRLCQARVLDHRAPRQAPGRVCELSPQGVAVACGQGELLLQALQAPGGRAQPAAAFLQGPFGRSLRVGAPLAVPDQ